MTRQTGVTQLRQNSVEGVVCKRDSFEVSGLASFKMHRLAFECPF